MAAGESADITTATDSKGEGRFIEELHSVPVRTQRPNRHNSARAEKFHCRGCWRLRADLGEAWEFVGPPEPLQSARIYDPLCATQAASVVWRKMPPLSNWSNPIKPQICPIRPRFSGGYRPNNTSIFATNTSGRAIFRLTFYSTKSIKSPILRGKALRQYAEVKGIIRLSNDRSRYDRTSSSSPNRSETFSVSNAITDLVAEFCVE
jgi:hypothetical protein